MVLFFQVIIIALLCEFCRATSAPFWLINSYLRNKTIGRFESTLPGGYIGIGPCPSYGYRCSLDFANLPASVKALQVSLPPPFDLEFTLGEAVPQGQLAIWLTELADVQFSNLEVKGTSLSPSKEKITIQVDNLKLDVNTELEIRNLIIPGVDLIGISTIGVKAKFSKALQQNGTQVFLETLLEAPVGKTFANALPRNISLTSCHLDLDIALSVELRTGYPFTGVQNGVTNFFIGLLEPLLGYVVCNYVAQQAFRTANGEPGIVVQVLDTVFTAVGNLTGLASPVVSVEESKFISVLTPEQRSKSLNFRNNSLVKSASNVIDGWLTQNLGVNKVLGLLTNPQGVLVLENLEKWGVTVEVPLPPFYVSVGLRNVTIKGLNTFGLFSILDNAYKQDNELLRREFTFGNRLNISTLSVQFSAMITLRDNLGYDEVDGGWIFDRLGLRNVQRETSFLLNYNVSLQGLALEAFVSLAADIEQLYPLQVGQLLGKSSSLSTTKDTAVEQLVEALKCASPALYGVSFPFLRLGLNHIDVPTFSTKPHDVGVSQLVDQVTELGLKILESGIKTNVPDIAQFWVRPLANSVIQSMFVSGGSLAVCSEFEPPSSATYPNFLTSTLFSTVSRIIRDAVGGNPVPQNDVSINKIITLVLETAVQTYDLPGTSTTDGHWLFAPDFRFLPSRSYAVPLSAVSFSKFQVFGLNSVSKLLVETLPPQPNGMRIDAAIGTSGNTLGIAIDSAWFIPAVVNEAFSLNVSLKGLTLGANVVANYNLNELYSFRLDQLFTVWCLFAPLESGSDFAFNATVQHVYFSLSTTSQGPANELRVALQTLRDEPSGNLTNMVNFVLQSLSNFVARNKESFFFNVDSTTCLNLPNPFNSVLRNVVSTLLSSNFTDLMLSGTQAQPPPLTPMESDLLVNLPLGYRTFDFQESTILPFVSQLTSFVSQSDFLSVLQTIGNSTAQDYLSILFRTFSDGSVGLDFNVSHIFPHAIPLDVFLENSTFAVKHVLLSNISLLEMSSLDILKLTPTSPFISDWFFHFPGEMMLRLELELTVPERIKLPQSQVNRLTETLVLELKFSDLTVDFSILTAFNLANFEKLTLAHLIALNPDTLEFGLNWDIFTCALGLFFEHGLFFPKLELSFGNYEPFLFDVVTSNQIVSKGVELTLQAMIHIIVDFYAKDLRDITQGFVRSFVNDYLFFPYVGKTTCPTPTVIALPVTQKYINFATNPTIILIHNFTTTYLAGDDGMYTLVNALLQNTLDVVTWFPEASTWFKFQGLPLVYGGETLAVINMSISDISLRGLGTFTELDLFQPQPAITTSFFNKLKLDGPVSFALRVHYSIDTLFPTKVDDSLRISVSISEVDFNALVDLVVDIEGLLVVPLGAFTAGNVNQLACVLQAIERVALTSFSLLFSNFSAEVSCVACSSTLLSSMPDNRLSTTQFDSLEEIAGLVPDFLLLVQQILSSDQFARFYSNSMKTLNLEDCSFKLDLSGLASVVGSETPPNFQISIILALLILGIVCGVAMLAPLAVPRHYHLKKQLMASELKYAEAKFPNRPDLVSKDMVKAERDSLSIVQHPSIPLCFKVFIPLVALMNIALVALSFLWYYAFAVTFQLTLLGNASVIVPILPLTIGNLIDYLWNSNFYVLGVGLVFLSALLPILKNLFLIGIMFSPRWFISPNYRRLSLTLLDVIGRVSFIEAFLIVIVAAVIRFRLVLANIGFLEKLPISEFLLIVDVSVTIEGGFVILCVASMLTLVLNHLVLYLIRKAEWSNERFFKVLDEDEDDALNASKTSVKRVAKKYAFAQHGETFSLQSQVWLTAASFVAMLALLLGQCLPCFTAEYNGVGGYAIALFEGSNTRTFSLMDLASRIQYLSDGTTLTNFKLFFFQFLYVMAIIIAPQLQMLLHAIVWSGNLSLERAKIVYNWAKICGYWASIDVFLVAVIALSIVGTPFVDFLIAIVTGGVCTTLSPTFGDIFGATNAGCMLVGFQMNAGFYIAWFAMMFQLVLGFILLRVNGLVLRDREEVLCKRPFGAWSWPEYMVMRNVLREGALVHRPIPRQGEMVYYAAEFYQDPRSQFAVHVASAKVLFRKWCCRCNCFGGIKDAGIVRTESSRHAKTGFGAAGDFMGATQSTNPVFRNETSRGKWNTAPPPPGFHSATIQQQQQPPVVPPSSARMQHLASTSQKIQGDLPPSSAAQRSNLAQYDPIF